MTSDVRKCDSKTVPSYSCDQCDFTTLYRSNLGTHKSLHTDRTPFVCEECGVHLKTARILIKHRLCHSNERPYKCDKCDYTCKRPGSLKGHYKIHTGEKPFQCSWCNYSARISSALKKHERIHTGEEPYKCSECNFTSRLRTPMLHHRAIHVGRKDHPCDQCSKSYVTKHELTRHLKSHAPEKPFKCPDCPSSFISPQAYEKHVLSHTDAEPRFHCGQCDKAFYIKSDLSIHLFKVHTEIFRKRVFECDVCQKRFKTKYRMQNHQLRHTGEKPYACNLCNYKTRIQPNLYKHQLIHSGKKPYSCKICDYTCSNPSNLTTHKKMHVRLASKDANTESKDHPLASKRVLRKRKEKVAYEEDSDDDSRPTSYRSDHNDSNFEMSDGGSVSPGGLEDCPSRRSAVFKPARIRYLDEDSDLESDSPDNSTLKTFSSVLQRGENCGSPSSEEAAMNENVSTHLEDSVHSNGFSENLRGDEETNLASYDREPLSNVVHDVQSKVNQGVDGTINSARSVESTDFAMNVLDDGNDVTRDYERKVDVKDFKFEMNDMVFGPDFVEPSISWADLNIGKVRVATGSNSASVPVVKMEITDEIQKENEVANVAVKEECTFY